MNIQDQVLSLEASKAIAEYLGESTPESLFKYYNDLGEITYSKNCEPFDKAKCGRHLPLYDLGYRKGQENMFIAIEKLSKMSKEDVNKKEVLITSVSYGKGKVETKIAEIKKQFKNDDIVTTITENKVDCSGKSESPLLDGFWKTFGVKSLSEIPKKFQGLAKKDPEWMLYNILDEAMRVAEKR